MVFFISLFKGLASPGSPTDVGKADGQCLRDGEIVVFDDIDTNWMNKASSGQRPGSNEDVLKVTKMIGQLPIAEYEGSPRRFGSQPNTNTITLGGPRKRPPGFPQRVSPTTSSAGNNATASAKASVGNLIDLIDHEEERSGALREKTPTFDYLYEFSETRKVLEEFFKANPEDEKRYTDYTTESGDDVASSVSTSYTSHTQMDCKVYLPFLFASSNRSTQLRPWSRHISANGWREYPKKSSTWCTARPLRSQ